MRKEIMEEYNDWWYTQKVPEELNQEFKRQLFFEIQKNLKKRYIMTIVGLRRCGKTTILYQLVDYLIQKGVNPEDILYFSFDERVTDLSEVVSTFKEIHNLDLRKNKKYLFLDEIQKLEDWENQIKRQYDLYPKMKFVISGSESLFVGKSTKETLAGRVHEFFLPPLSFREFLEIKGIKPKPYAPRIKPEFIDYIRKGGFPEIVNETNPKEIGRYVRSSVIDKILYRDIPQLSGIRNVELLHQLLELIAINPGMYLNYQNLAQRLDADRRTIKEYVMWLSDGFLIRLLGNFRGGSASLRKDKRAYLSDTGIITAFKPTVDEAFFGRMVENAVINALDAGAFWKNRHEVDAVLNGTCVEVKYQKSIIKSDLKGTLEFMRKFKSTKGFVISKDREEVMKTEHGEVFFKPAWKLLLDPGILKKEVK